jgi:probable F420-dependent oxidoreductase
MAPRIGYLLPTRESVMQGRPQTAPLLALAEKAEALGYASVWVGDSLMALPRHEPITLLAAVAARTSRVSLGTAVLLPGWRNPVVLAQQVATLDQISEGRVILGVGIASDVATIRADFQAAGVPFEKRVGRLLEGLRLCRKLWTGKPVTWDGRWTVDNRTLGPEPYQPGGPPIWIGGSVPATVERVGRHLDGWFPNEPMPDEYREIWTEMKSVARDAGRDPDKLTGAQYLTVAIDDNAARADRRIDEFMETYYGKGSNLRESQPCYAGSLAGAKELLAAYASAGASHFVLRFAGEHEQQLELFAGIEAELSG